MPPELVEWLASCNRDPVRFVLGAFEWGEGLLEERQIEAWQLELLEAIRDGLLTPNAAIKLARASGHGIGKSTVVAWIILWAFSTAPDTVGVVTANTEPQLKTKTWKELGVWFNRFIAKEFFKLGPTTLQSRDRSRERTWRVDAIAWSEKNPEAFAGLHNKGRRLFLIFDEASAIDDVIWETAEGALTDADTEIIWLAFGNPTRNTGRFKTCFDTTGLGRSWQTRQIDSREVSLSNKQQIADWIEDYGDDSDFVRVRVKGEFPRVGDTEFISASVIDAAMSREPPPTRGAEPLALGVDVARYGDNASVLFFRQGRDGRTIKRQRYQGVNTVELANRVISAYLDLSPDGIFVDGGGVGGGVVDNLRAQAYHCFDVQFGAKDDVRGFLGNAGEKYANKRSAMWGAMRNWLNTGAIPRDEALRAQLLAPRYGLNKQGEIQLETKEDMKRRGVPSPDDADALALTFAYPLQKESRVPGRGNVEADYNPFGEERMAV